MTNNEELKAVGIEVRECKESHKNLLDEEYKKYNGYCKNCYEKMQELKNEKNIYNNENEEMNVDFEDNGKNIVATVVKGIAIISAIAGLIVGLISIDELNSEIMAVAIIIISIISAVLVYALGEIIQKLENIERNTRK